MGAIAKKKVDLVIEIDAFILHYSVTNPLLSQTFIPLWEVVIGVIMSLVLKTTITFVATVLMLCNNLDSLRSKIR